MDLGKTVFGELSVDERAAEGFSMEGDLLGGLLCFWEFICFFQASGHPFPVMYPGLIFPCPPWVQGSTSGWAPWVPRSVHT